MCSDDKIILEIEETPVVCKKEDLISNSDYFKAMLEGNFVERSKEKIKLHEVDLKAMNTILSLITEKINIIENEDLLMVLQAACMLQFIQIKERCIKRLTDVLSQANCLSIWRVTEPFDIKPLYLKAKCMALKDFLQIKSSSCFLELTVDELYQYLGHINLNTDCELTVFHTIMLWWKENSTYYIENQNKFFLKLLSCIDYQNLSEEHLKEMIEHPYITKNLEINKILSCLISIKNNKTDSCFSKSTVETVKLLCKSKSRTSIEFPCLLIRTSRFQSKLKVKKQLVQSFVEQHCHGNLPGIHKRRKVDVSDNDKDLHLLTIYYDYDFKTFKKFFDIREKFQQLDGFRLMPYKQYVILYGGEFSIGSGIWNESIYVYDTIKELWKRKGILQWPRRHFETCMVGSKVYMLGGTGHYRIYQDNMYWFDCFEDKRSITKIDLPCPMRESKCCDFLNQVFILNINNKCGYFFVENTYSWEKIDIINNENLIDIQCEFSVFSKKDILYIKGRQLVKLIIKDQNLYVISVKNITDFACDKMESVLCGNIVYTFYKYRYEDGDMFSLEAYYLETDEVKILFKDKCGSLLYSLHNVPIDLDGEQFLVGYILTIFKYQFHNSVAGNKLINNCFQ